MPENERVRRIEERTAFDMGMRGEDPRETIGRLPVNNISAEKIEGPERHKKDERAIELAMLLEDLAEERELIRAAMTHILKEIEANQRLIEDGIAILMAGDVSAARQFLKSEYDQDLTDHKDAVAMSKLKDRIGESVMTQIELFREFEGLAKSYRATLERDPTLANDPELLDQHLSTLHSLREKASTHQLDFERARADVHEVLGASAVKGNDMLSTSRIEIKDTEHNGQSEADETRTLEKTDLFLKVSTSLQP